MYADSMQNIDHSTHFYNWSENHAFEKNTNILISLSANFSEIFQTRYPLSCICIQLFTIVSHASPQPQSKQVNYGAHKVAADAQNVWVITGPLAHNTSTSFLGSAHVSKKTSGDSKDCTTFFRGRSVKSHKIPCKRNCGNTNVFYFTLLLNLPINIFFLFCSNPIEFQASSASLRSKYSTKQPTTTNERKWSDYLST